MKRASEPVKALVAAYIDENHREATLLKVWPEAKSPEDPWGREFEVAGCRHLDELGLSYPKATGLWVWEGHIFYPSLPYAGIWNDGPDWRGEWRLAKLCDMSFLLDPDESHIR
jgi:hypothetical protein